MKFEQTHDAYIITIPTAEAWVDPLLTMTVKMLERYDPAREREQAAARFTALAEARMLVTCAGCGLALGEHAPWCVEIGGDGSPSSSDSESR